MFVDNKKIIYYSHKSCPIQCPVNPSQRLRGRVLDDLTIWSYLQGSQSSWSCVLGNRSNNSGKRFSADRSQSQGTKSWHFPEHFISWLPTFLHSRGGIFSRYSPGCLFESRTISSWHNEAWHQTFFADIRSFPRKGSVTTMLKSGQPAGRTGPISGNTGTPGLFILN